jgi:diguanylate cyclase (GGDEF)-like protein
MILDLDKFKMYNDTYGHLAGDNLIKDLARLVESSLRTIDIAARFGGDEFVAIFPQTPKKDAIQIVNRIKDKIDAALNIDHGKISLSVSMGVATYPDDASSIMELMEKTDEALYLAKKGGGDRVVYL